jgi:CRISPR-associated protein Cas1
MTLTRVMAVHAWAYCPRLFYLEEVEEIRLADEKVFEGRTLHEQLAQEEEGELHTLTLESDTWSLAGRLDAVRKQDGQWLVVEHKKGRSRKPRVGKAAEAWPSDRLQAGAYAVLLEEHLGLPVPEARVRYHADAKSARVIVDDSLKAELRNALDAMNPLREQVQRPPLTPEANRCIHCSLSPVCLPEEERLGEDPTWEPLRLFPGHHDRTTVHVTGPGTSMGRSDNRLIVRPLEGPEEVFPIADVEQVLIHGNAQITSQAMALCLAQDVQVHWVTGGGRYLGGTAAGSGGVQRKVRQYQALDDPETRMALARRIVLSKCRMQLRFLLRATRGKGRGEELESAVDRLREAIAAAERAQTPDHLRGCEGEAGNAYFGALDTLLLAGLPPELHFRGRNRRPPRDPVNALLSFGYALLYRDMVAAILAVGLEPALGVLHTPRSAAYPLALDLMEIFRVPLVDMPVIASLNRGQWNPDTNFHRLGQGVLLTEEGRKQAIGIFETRKAESWRHPILGYSLTYHRMMELEARLLEKSWMGHPELFAAWSLR